MLRISRLPTTIRTSSFRLTPRSYYSPQFPCQNLHQRELHYLTRQFIRSSLNSQSKSSSKRWLTGSTTRSSGSATADLPKSNSSRPAGSRLLRVVLGLTLLSTAYGIGVLFPPSLYTLIWPREAPPAPAAGSPAALKEQKKLEEELWEIPIVRELAKVSYPLNTDNVPAAFLGPPEVAAINGEANLGHTKTTNKDGTELTHYMTRPYCGIPEPLRRHSLTAGLLQGPGRIAIPPLMFVRLDEKAVTTVIHLGRSICGHDGIVHGGGIATLFDDGLFRTAVANFPARIGVTAWLRVDYKVPTRADQWVVFKSQVDKVEGRKVFVSGVLEDLSGTILVKAEALFVQPKYAHLLKNEEREKSYLGRPAAITRTLEPVAETSDMK